MLNIDFYVLIDFLLQIKKGKFKIIIMLNQFVNILPVGINGHKYIAIPDKIQISKSVK